MVNDSVIGSFWTSFQTEMPEDIVEDQVNLIILDVLDNYGIPYDINTNYFQGDSGKLLNVDLKRVSPIPVIKASLLEVFAMTNRNLVEFSVNPDGEVYIYEVGHNIANMHIYYSIPSTKVLPNNIGVMVTGAKPRTKRKIYDWVPIIGAEAEDYTIWHAGHLSTGCMLSGLTSLAVVTYKDPLLESGNTSYNNGIENMFEVESVYESIVGWAWKVIPPEEYITDTVRIIQQNQSSVPMLLDQNGRGLLPEDEAPAYKLGLDAVSPNIGELVRRQPVTDIEPDEEGCYIFEDTDRECTDKSLHVTIPIKEGLTYQNSRGIFVSKFLGVNTVYVVAVELLACRGIRRPNGALDDNSPENTFTFISSDNTNVKVCRLKEGEEYIILYPESIEYEHAFCIQFANNSMYNDNAKFGTDVEFFVDTEADELRELFSGGNPLPDDAIGLVGRGTLLPVNNDGSGLLIQQVWLQVDLDAPCFVINDARGNAAKIAEELEVYLTAIAIEDRDPPRALNGELIERSPDEIPDNDPTTIQDFEDTAYERAMEKMASGRTMDINLASLDEDATVNLSRKLYELMLKDDGVIYNHVCDPSSDPKLGDRAPNGGIVNEISYDYSDSGSYLISVTEGPEFYGDFAGLSGGLYYKKVETVNAVGTIIQDYGNHIDFKVRVDGYGDIVAINSYPGVLDVRDRVNVTIYNNEVED